MGGVSRLKHTLICIFLRLKGVFKAFIKHSFVTPTVTPTVTAT